jgi:hypothetical protein
MINMFQRFKSARKLRRANKAASHVRPLIAASLFPVSEPGGEFDSRLTSDAFVVGYIYGVITACDKTGDHEEQGFFMMQMFEQLFPNHGRVMTEYCNSQVLQKNPDFKQYTRVGFAEMIELVNSEGRTPLGGLLSHVCEHYTDGTSQQAK